MRAVVCERLGNPAKPLGQGPLALLENCPPPECGPKGVRIGVQASSLNFADMLQIQGLYQEKAKLPFIPGSEVFGTVIEVGHAVRGLQIGDEVIAISQGGGFAEQCVADKGAVFKVPGRGDAALAGLPVAFGTAHLSLSLRARLKPGEKILVLGAAGGVGSAAVQVAKAMGASVFAVARGHQKVHMLQSIGADAVFDSESYPTVSSLVAVVKAAAPEGVNVLVDPVGGKQFDAGLRCMARGGRALMLGFASGSIPKIPANIMLVKNLEAHGVYWGSYLQHDPVALQQSMQQLLQWWAEGRIHVPVSHRIPFHRVNEGFEALASREARGKVLVTVAPVPKL